MHTPHFWRGTDERDKARFSQKKLILWASQHNRYCDLRCEFAGLHEHWLLELTPALSTRMAERSMHQPCPEQCSGQPSEAPDSHAMPVKPASQTHEPKSHRPRPWHRAGHAEVPQSSPRQLASQRHTPFMHTPFPWQSAGQPPLATRGLGREPTKPAANGTRSSMLLLLPRDDNRTRLACYERGKAEDAVFGPSLEGRKRGDTFGP